MAVEKVINVRVNDGELDGLEQNLNQVAAGFDKVDKEAKQADKSVDDVASNGGAIAILDQLTGGLATRLRDAWEASKLFNVSLRATRGALIATGIGAFVVALGLIVEYWDDIVEFIKESNKQLQRQIDFKTQLIDNLNHELEILALQEKQLELQGKSTQEIKEQREEILNSLILENEAQLELLKTQQLRELQQATELSIWQKILVATGQAVAVADGLISEDEQTRLNELNKGIQETEKNIIALRNKLLEGDVSDSARDKETALEGVLTTEQQAERNAKLQQQFEELFNIKKLQQEALIGLDQEGIDRILNNERTKNIQLEAEDIKLAQSRKERRERERIEEEILNQQKIALTQQTLGSLINILGENSAAGKAAATAQALINTYQGVTQVLSNETTLPEPFGTINKIASIGSILATGFKAVKDIQATKLPSFAGGGGVSTGGSVSAPSFNVVGASGVNQLAQTLQQEQQPIEAFVVGSNVTSQQALDRNIVETATVSG